MHQNIIAIKKLQILLLLTTTHRPNLIVVTLALCAWLLPFFTQSQP
jgi:hypothetical protein